MVRHRSTAACLKCLCDQHILRSFAEQFLDVATTRELWGTTTDAHHAGLHHLLLEVGAHVSSSLWDPSGSAPCLFLSYLTSSTSQWEFLCGIWANRVVSFSCLCWSGHCSPGTPRSSAAVVWNSPLAMNCFSGA